MQKQDAANDLKLIREMIEDTKRSTLESWPFLINWGVLALIACALTALWEAKEAYPLIGVTWFGFMVVGLIGSILIGRSLYKTRPMRTFTDKIQQWLWMTKMVSLFLIAFVMPAGGIYPYEEVPVLVAIVIATGIFFTGGIFNWPLLKFSGVCWWVGSIVIMLLPVESYMIVFVVLLVIGYLIPGFIMRNQHLKTLAQNHA